jgi:hypothetical protein
MNCLLLDGRIDLLFNDAISTLRIVWCRVNDDCSWTWQNREKSGLGLFQMSLTLRYCGKSRKTVEWTLSWVNFKQGASTIKGRVLSVKPVCSVNLVMLERRVLFCHKRKRRKSLLGDRLSWGFCGFPQSLQENAKILLKIGHDCSLPLHFQFSVH